MNKTELNDALNFTEGALLESGVDFAPADRTGTNAELEKELERLESLLPEEGTLVNSVDHSLPTTGDQELEKDTHILVTIAGGINIEQTVDGKKQVLQGGSSYRLDRERASVLIDNDWAFENDEIA